MNLKLREEYSRLFYPKELSVMIESYKFITNVAFNIIHEHGKIGVKSDLEEDANLLFQMTSMKCISILSLSEQINYTNAIDGVSIKNIYDPFSVYNLVRAQYEAFCNFNNIYIQASNKDEMELKYLLWVISGLSYRQRFNIEGDENVGKQEDEKRQIEEIKKSIVVNSCFTSLDAQSQQNILDGIKKRDWQFKIIGIKAYKIAWHEMMTNAGTNKLLEGLYTFLSLSTHPSNVSVFQYKDLYKGDNHNFLMRMALQISKIFMSMLIRDYITYFPNCKQVFEKLSAIHQILINSNNYTFRDETFVVNQCGNNIYKL